MAIPSVASGLTSTQESTQIKKKNSLTQEDFLNLFTTQMRYQNPLQPLDNNEMATQLAQFNTVDALAKMNETLNQLLTSQASLNSLQASNLIGKRIEAKGDRLTLQGGAVSDGAYQLASPGKATIQIFNSNGNLVRQIDAAVQDTAVHSIGWDGKSQSGASLPDGAYTFRVLATDAKGQGVTANTYRWGKVDGVTFENGAAVFQMAGDKISFSDIISIVN